MIKLKYLKILRFYLFILNNMCGIFAIVNKNTPIEEDKLYGIKEGKKFGDDEYHDIINDSFMLGTNRGPESQTLLKIDNNYLGFHRLAINGYGNKSSEQPIKKHNCTLICNSSFLPLKFWATTSNSSSLISFSDKRFTAVHSPSGKSKIS